MAQSTSYRGETPTKGRNTEGIGRMADEAGEMAGRAMDQGRELTQQVQETAHNVRRAVDRSLKEQPYTTLAAAAIVGFVLGALWKS